jgi:hypothetical protein
MQMAARMNNAVEAARYADTLLLSYEVPSTVRDEARMYVVRQRIANGEKGAQLDSMLMPLAQSENGLVAAEARYLITESLLHAGKLNDAEAAASSNIKRSAGYEYWVVKTYLLLSDVLIAEKDYFNARATLQSVAQNSRIPALKAEAARKLDELKKLESSKLSNE